MVDQRAACAEQRPALAAFGPHRLGFAAIFVLQLVSPWIVSEIDRSRMPCHGGGGVKADASLSNVDHPIGNRGQPRAFEQSRRSDGAEPPRLANKVVVRDPALRIGHMGKISAAINRCPTTWQAWKVALD